MQKNPVILIVDEQPQNIELLEAYLIPHGYKILTASNGNEALETLATHLVDLILLDVMMPNMDGFEVTRRVRLMDDLQQLPIILVTALRETEDRVRGSEAGCDDFISKPVDKNELLSRVRSLLKVKAYNDLKSNYQKELVLEVAKRTEELKHALETIVKSKKLLEESEEKFRSITTTAQDGIVIMNDDGIITYWNAAAQRIFGYTQQEAIGKELHSLLSPERFHEAQRSGFRHFINTGEGPAVGKTNELIALKKDGMEFPIELSLSANMREGKWEAIGMIRDISQRKKDEAGLKIFRTLLDHSSDSIEVIEPLTMRYLDVNDTSCNKLGYSREELLTMSVFDINPLIDSAFAQALLTQLLESGNSSTEGIQKSKDGSIYPVEVVTTLVQLEKPYILAIVRDITERKLAEKSLLNANRALKTLSTANMALVQAQSEDELLKCVVDVIVNEGNYSLAVVDYAQENSEKTIIPMAWSALEGKHYWIKELSWSDTAANQMPLSKVIRTATMHITHNIAAETECTLWRDAALAQGYTASIAFPLIEGDKVFGALNIYSSETNAFTEEEVPLLEELANDLAYGIVSLRTRVAHEQQAVILLKSLEQSIQTIAAIVEARDPYTAGHQKHVSELATAIAKEMGLSKEQINGIHLAAIIHDLGKIHIPAEILSKPGKLSSLELQMIQLHPQAGYDILKDVIFPWPIANIILQHHEKLDGSGYPQGLRGDQILLEAKIITVADVVEAISSHRPYRAALGIDVALDEIRHGKGIVYDPLVVDACLKLFTKKEFVFSGESL